MLTTILLLFITTISKITGFLREMIIASSFGVSSQADAFFLVTIIPLLIFAVIGTALKDSMIPSLSRLKEPTNNEIFRDFLAISTIFTISISVVLIIFSDNILLLIDPHKIVSKQEYYVGVTMLIFVVINNITMGKLLSEQKFIPAALYGLLSNGAVIVYYFSSPGVTVFGLLICLTVGLIMHTLLQLLFTSTPIQGFNFKITKGIKSIYLNSLPIIFGSAILELSVLIDRIIASYLGNGSISAINYANRLSFFLINILAMVLITPFYSKISKMPLGIVEEKKKLLTKYIFIIAVIILPLTFIGLIFSKTIIQITFGRGAFDDYAINLTESAFIFYLLASPFFCYRDILTKYFYTEGLYKITLKNGIYTLFINAVLSFFLSKEFGIQGISMATFISIVVTTVMLQRKLSDKKLNLIILLSALLTSIAFIGIIFY